jgi:hypothetical protein
MDSVKNIHYTVAILEETVLMRFFDILIYHVTQYELLSNLTHPPPPREKIEFVLFYADIRICSILCFASLFLCDGDNFFEECKFFGELGNVLG